MVDLEKISEQSKGQLMGFFGGSFGSESNIGWLNKCKREYLIEFLNSIIDPINNSDYTHPDEYSEIFDRLEKIREKLKKVI